MGFSTSNWRVYCGRTDQASIAWTCLPKPFWLDKNVNNHQKLERRREKIFFEEMKINIKMFAFLQAIFSCQTSKLAFGWWSAVLGFRSHQLTHMALRMSIAQEYSVGLNRKHIGNPWKVVVGATRLWDLGICTFQGAQYRVDFSFSIGFNSILRKKGTFFFFKDQKTLPFHGLQHVKLACVLWSHGPGVYCLDVFAEAILTW